MENSDAQTAHDSAMDTGIIDQARELVQLLQAGKTEEAGQKLNELCRSGETGLYQDIGKLTRELHEAFHTFNKDGDLHVLMKADMSDAMEHLDHVIQKTESSAHQTLGAIESCTPLIDGLEDEAAALHRQLHALQLDKAMGEDIHKLASATDVFLSRIKTDTSQIRDSMKTVLMAQEYQDVTGQIIQRVIRLVQQLEMNLVDILRASARYVDAKSGATADSREHSKRIARADISRGDDALNQDDVDDLLDSLGF